MNLLLDNFERLIQTKEEVEKIKQVILNLAVRGKLVEQNSQDKSIETMFLIIQQEKDQLIRDNIIKAKKQSEPITTEEIPYQLPQGWKWVRLSDISYNFGQKVPDEQFTYIDVSAIDKSKGIISEEYKILQPVEAPSRARKIVKKGTVIFSTVRPYLLNVAIVETDFKHQPIVSTAFAVMHPYRVIDIRFLFYYLRSQPFVEFVQRNMAGVAYPAISEGEFFKGLFPLPPYEEQKRISQKIKLLFDLCDQLSAKVEANEHASNVLNRSAFNVVNNNEKVSVFKGIDFVVKNFNHLCNTQADIKTLRDCILSLAVKGLLIPQSSIDEPATELLKKIREEKERLIKEKKIKKEKPLPPILPEEIPYELPKGWEWVRVGEISLNVEYGTSTKASTENIGIPVLRMNNIRNAEVIFDDLKYVLPDIDDLPRLYLKHGDILFNRTNSYELVGKSGVFEGNDDEATFASYLIRIQLFQEHTNPKFINFFLNSTICRKQQIEPNITQQNGQANFNGTKLKNIVIPLPPVNEQHKIVEKIDMLMQQCKNIENQIFESKRSSEHLLQAILMKVICSEKDSD